MKIKAHNKAVKYARKKHGLDAPQKTLRTTYVKRYAKNKL